MNSRKMSETLRISKAKINIYLVILHILINPMYTSTRQLCVKSITATNTQVN
jgi:hypothetical protein